MRPIIAVTMGDPAGIGSELCVKVLAKKEVYDKCRPLVIGDLSCIKDALGFTKTEKKLEINVVKDPGQGKYVFGTIDLIDLGMVDISKLNYGTVSSMNGKAAGAYIKKAIDLALDKKVDATVTNPIHKESFSLGGWGKKYPGHTEMFADLTKTKNYSMMLAHENLRVVHVSTHVSLKKAIGLVKKEKVLETIKIAHNACKDLGVKNPKIGVAGLNPHASDSGLFGDEEEKEIIPAVEEAKSQGFDAEGPVPPDTVFSKARGGWYDIVVAMYHDQGHIPMKLVGFVYDKKADKWSSVSGVNITLGLPIIRTSVDHGTAFGKAGKGRATEDSLYEAVMYAIRFANTKLKKRD